MDNFVEIRCPAKKRWKLNRRDEAVKYRMCGSLLGAISAEDVEDCIFVRCSVCGAGWIVTVDFYGNIEMTREDGKVPLVDRLKDVNECRE